MDYLITQFEITRVEAQTVLDKSEHNLQTGYFKLDGEGLELNVMYDGWLVAVITSDSCQGLLFRLEREMDFFNWFAAEKKKQKNEQIEMEL